MGIFDKFKKVKAVNSNKEKPSGGHGPHFEAALGDMELVEGLVLYASKEPDRKETLAVETPAFGKSPLFVGVKEVNKSLNIAALVVSEQFYTAYPISTNTTKYPAVVKEVVEWQNALEAWVSAKIGDATLSFFAADYYKNKKRYAPSQKLNIKLAAFAYRISKAEEQKVKTKDGKELSTGNMCAILPYSLKDKSAFDDDYLFQGQIMDIIEFGSNRVFKTKVAIFGNSSLELWIYALGSVVKGNFKKGDYISGVLWLQGAIA